MFKQRMLVCVITVGLMGAFASETFAQSQRAGQATFGNLIAALNNINVQIQRLEDLVDIGDVTVIDVSNLLQGARIRALNNALNRNNVEIITLRNVLNNLDLDVDVDIGQVVAVDVLSGGDIIIFR